MKYAIILLRGGWIADLFKGSFTWCAFNTWGCGRLSCVASEIGNFIIFPIDSFHRIRMHQIQLMWIILKQQPQRHFSEEIPPYPWFKAQWWKTFFDANNYKLNKKSNLRKEQTRPQNLISASVVLFRLFAKISSKFLNTTDSLDYKIIYIIQMCFPKAMY